MNEYRTHKCNELRIEDIGKKVKIAGLSIEWENGEDVCPEKLYYESESIKE